MQTSFHNTIELEGVELQKAEESCKKMDDVVFSEYLAKGYPMSPMQAYRNLKFNPEQVPLTSIRRSINTLTKQGKLIKTQHKVKESYGKANYLWMINILL